MYFPNKTPPTPCVIYPSLRRQSVRQSVRLSVCQLTNGWMAHCDSQIHQATSIYYIRGAKMGFSLLLPGITPSTLKAGGEWDGHCVSNVLYPIHFLNLCKPPTLRGQFQICYILLEICVLVLTSFALSRSQFVSGVYIDTTIDAGLFILDFCLTTFCSRKSILK